MENGLVTADGTKILTVEEYQSCIRENNVGTTPIVTQNSKLANQGSF
jgi:hypothetical protein